MLSIRLVGLMVLALAWASGTEAAWHQAKSKHFIIYADEDPRDLREFSEKLEKFDSAVRRVRGMPDYPVGDGNRLQVFVTRSDAAVRRLANDKTGFVRGFYLPRASGSVAFVPRSSGSGSAWDLDAETVFFHEYAHHLMMQDLDTPVPEWLVEGFAEFMSTVRFEKDGYVGLGAAPQHRAYGLFQLERLPLEKMLGGAYDKISVDERESIYGRGWLLTHYMTFEPTRRGQLAAYLTAIARGTNALEAATSAFGDLKQLDRDLNNYLKRRRLSYLRVEPSRLTISPIEVSRLSPGAAAVIPLRMESKRGVNDKTDGPLAERIRRVAQQYPGDPLVEATLAEAEFDAENYDAAEAAADRALRADPRNTEAMIYKGRAILERAARSDDPSASSFAEARQHFIAANKIDPEDPEPLLLFYNSFSRAGERPTANAIEALHYASNLAPQDLGLRIGSAVQYLRDGKLPEARRTLVPLAYNPHGGGLAITAREVIDRIDAGDRRGAETVANRDPQAEETETTQP